MNSGMRSVRWLLWLFSLAGGYAIAQWLLRDKTRRRPDMVAHRGGALSAPESTAAAYKNAIAHGFAALELDIQMTSDGELVVFHDDTVDRTTDGTGPVAEKTLAEMKALDAGSWFGEEFRGERVLTLREMIEIARTGPNDGCRLLLEIKSPHLYPGIEAKMISILAETGYLQKTLVMSFDGTSLEKVRELLPTLPLCHLLAPPNLVPPKPAGDAETFGPSWHILAVNPSWVRLAHEVAGRRVYVWTVNDLWVFRLMRAIGVDGIITDNVDLIDAV